VKPQYQSGKPARENFERAMTALFRAPKSAVKAKPAPKPKKKGKD
jgi:hypothetical protein